MPRRSKNQNRRRGRGGRGVLPSFGHQGESRSLEPRGTIRFPFRKVFQFSTSASTGLTMTTLNASSCGARINSLAPNFQNYRMRELSFTLLPSAQGSDVCFGYTPQPLENLLPSTYVQILEEMPFTLTDGGFQTVPTTLDVPTKYLMRKEQPWLRVTTATGDTLGETSFGSLTGATKFTSSIAITVMMDGVIEFCNPTVSGFSAEPVKDSEEKEPSIPSNMKRRPFRMPIDPDELTAGFELADRSCAIARQEVRAEEKERASTHGHCAEFEVSSDWASASGDLPDLTENQVADLFKKFCLLVKPVKANVKPSA